MTRNLHAPTILALGVVVICVLAVLAAGIGVVLGGLS